MQPHAPPREDSPATRLLVVEDHAATRLALMTLLGATFHACRIEAAGTAEDALETCESDPPAVVVMDITLPGMNGIDASRHIRERFPAIHIVMHTGNDMQVYRDQADALGVAAFVSKRQPPADLLAAIAGLLPRD